MYVRTHSIIYTHRSAVNIQNTVSHKDIHTRTNIYTHTHKKIKTFQTTKCKKKPSCLQYYGGKSVDKLETLPSCQGYREWFLLPDKRRHTHTHYICTLCVYVSICNVCVCVCVCVCVWGGGGGCVGGSVCSTRVVGRAWCARRT